MSAPCARGLNPRAEHLIKGVRLPPERRLNSIFICLGRYDNLLIAGRTASGFRVAFLSPPPYLARIDPPFRRGAEGEKMLDAQQFADAIRLGVQRSGLAAGRSAADAGYLSLAGTLIEYLKDNLEVTVPANALAPESGPSSIRCEVR
jgi:hypothetical protein